MNVELGNVQVNLENVDKEELRQARDNINRYLNQTVGESHFREFENEMLKTDNVEGLMSLKLNVDQHYGITKYPLRRLLRGLRGFDEMGYETVDLVFGEKSPIIIGDFEDNRVLGWCLAPRVGGGNHGE